MPHEKRGVREDGLWAIPWPIAGERLLNALHSQSTWLADIQSGIGHMNTSCGLEIRQEERVAQKVGGPHNIAFCVNLPITESCFAGAVQLNQRPRGRAYCSRCSLTQRKTDCA